MPRCTCGSLGSASPRRRCGHLFHALRCRWDTHFETGSNGASCVASSSVESLGPRFTQGARSSIGKSGSSSFLSCSADNKAAVSAAESMIFQRGNLIVLQSFRYITERLNCHEELSASLVQFPASSTRHNARSIPGEFDFTTHRCQVSDRNVWSVNVCNLETDVDACPLTLKPDCFLSASLVVVPAQNCGGHAEGAAPLSVSYLPPSTLPSLCSESKPSMRIQLFSFSSCASQPGGVWSSARAY